MKTCKRWFTVAGGAFMALGLVAQGARADYYSTDDHVPSPNYRSTNSVIYATPGGQFKIDSFFDVFTDLVRVPPPPPPAGNFAIDSFFDVFTELSFDQLGLPPSGIRESPTKQTIKYTRLNGLPPGEPVLFQTEMLSLDLTGGGTASELPSGVMIRESPTLQSTGQTRITDVGGGLYRVNSFFDIFTELSLDGGMTWNPGLSPLHLQGSIPEPSTLALAGLALTAITSIARRRVRRGG